MVVNGLVEVGVVPELMHFAYLVKQYLLLLFVGVQHIPDTERKQSVAWAALREAADVFLRPLYESLQEFAVPLRNSTRLRLE